MRTVLGLCVAFASLCVCQPASAAFSFILTPVNATLTLPTGPTTQLLTVSALDTNAGSFGSQFFMDSVSNLTTGTSVTFSNFTPFVANTTLYNASNAPGGNAIGTITATGVSNGVSTIQFRGTIANNNIQGVAPFTPFTSNVATLTVVSVPEPSSFALIGVAGLGYVIYRKRRAAKV